MPALHSDPSVTYTATVFAGSIDAPVNGVKNTGQTKRPVRKGEQEQNRNAMFAIWAILKGGSTLEKRV